MMTGDNKAASTSVGLLASLLDPDEERIDISGDSVE